MHVFTDFYRFSSSLEPWPIAVLADCRKDCSKWYVCQQHESVQLHRNQVSYRSAHVSLVNVFPSPSSATEPCSLETVSPVYINYSKWHKFMMALSALRVLAVWDTVQALSLPTHKTLYSELPEQWGTGSSSSFAFTDTCKQLSSQHKGKQRKPPAPFHSSSWKVHSAPLFPLPIWHHLPSSV